MATDHNPQASPINIRALKILVIVMGVLIVAGVAVIVVTIVNRLRAMSEAEPRIAGFGEIELAVPAGARIADMTLDGNRMLLRLDGDGGGRILVLDLATGDTLGTVNLVPTP